MNDPPPVSQLDDKLFSWVNKAGVNIEPSEWNAMTHDERLVTIYENLPFQKIAEFKKAFPDLNLIKRNKKGGKRNKSKKPKRRNSRSKRRKTVSKRRR